MVYIAKNIEKEDIEFLIFPQKPIRLKNKLEQNRIIRRLENATTIGNLHHRKVEITFQDSIGLKKVNTTIWATGEKYIVLKKGVIIPINRIVQINF
jgi:uncharacterized protein (UPF0248 family)